MSVTELKVLEFVQTLPQRDQRMFFLIQAYRDYLSKFDNALDYIRRDANCIFTEFYEEQAKKIIDNSLIYEINHRRNDDAEKSVPITRSKLASIDKQLDEKFGEWASSFSRNSSFSEEDGKHNNASEEK